MSTRKRYDSTTKRAQKPAHQHARDLADAAENLRGVALAAVATAHTMEADLGAVATAAGLLAANLVQLADELAHTAGAQ